MELEIGYKFFQIGVRIGWFMLMWIVLGLVIAVVTVVFTLIWWKVGDQWADEEYKRFGHGGGGPQGPPPRVIRDLDSEPRTIADSDTPTDAG
jgi:hypothetical protein